MTHRSTLEAAARLPRDELWGIGLYRARGVLLDAPVSWDDIEQDTAWARQLLALHGVGRGDVVLVLAGGNEATWFHPLQDAVAALGGVSAMAWARASDARRTEMFARLLSPKVVAGLNGQVAAVLAELPGSLEGQLAGSVVFARADASTRLVAAGLRPVLLELLGPALVLGCPEGVGAHLDPSQWSVAEVDGELLLTTVGHRGCRVDRQPTGLLGHVIEDACACGLPGPRVLVSGTA